MHGARVLIGVALLVVCVVQSPAAGPPDLCASQRPGGGKWRLAYMEGGAYPHYAYVLRALVLNLARAGWMETPGPDFPEKTDVPAEIWAWLSARAVSRYLEFPADAFWSSEWDKERRGRTREEALRRLSGQRDLDAVLALGTWAGQDLAVDGHAVPVLVFQTSDPVAAGIVQSAKASGRSHVFAHCDPQRYSRQIALFHELVRFKRLGIAYEDTPDGRAYGAVADAEALAAERGFSLERCHTRTNVPDLEEAVASYEACSRDLADRADAVYMTHSRAMTLEALPRLLDPLLERRIPTFSQGGAEFVKRGVLMSMAQTDFMALGRFFAETLGRCLNGARPGDLDQVFEDDPSIALNMRTAKRVGFLPSLEVLSAAALITGQGE